MQRKVKDLQDAVNAIHIKEAMQREIMQNVESSAKRGNQRFFKAATAAALIVLVVGALHVPVRAIVQSFMQARMEEMTEVELQALIDNINRSQVNADSFSRSLTEEEERKFKELAAKYKKGVFPEGELPRAESVEEAERLELCFLIPYSTFYLPDRELTEEEMLQIIDFYVKRDYALRKYVDGQYGDEFKVKTLQELREQRKVEFVENGGITEEEAMEIAKKWLFQIYGVTGDDMECRLYFSEYVPIADKMIFYHLKCMDPSGGQFYSLHIDAEDGSLASAQSYDENGEEKLFDASKAEALLPELEQSAVAFVKEQLQLTYEDIYYFFYCVDDAVSPTVGFLFVQEDNNAFTLEYFWDGTFGSFQKSLFSTDQEKYEELKASAERKWNAQHNGEEAEITLYFEKREESFS